MRYLWILACLGITACGGGGGGGGGTSIGSIQGGGTASPVAGQRVTVTGIVTGDFQSGDGDDTRDLGGFFLQQADGDGDSDPATSDGVFVFDGNNPSVDVDAGDRVTVAGTVNEHFGETQISASRVVIDGSGSVSAVDVNLPASAIVENSDGVPVADLERYEGMLVRFPQSLTATAVHELERFGSVQVSQGGRLFQFTNSNRPDVGGYAAHRADIGSRRIHLDDGRRAEDVTPIRLLDAGAVPGYSLRTGDVISGATGNLRFSRGSGPRGAEGWRLMPTLDPVFESTNPRPSAPSVAGTLRIASFNVLNFFTTIDNGRPVCGPRSDQGCRGADKQQEFDRQLAKTTTALAMMDADIVGLMELENNASASLQQLVDALNDRLGAGTYAHVNTGTIGDDVIKTGFLYQTATVAPIGDYAVIDGSVNPGFRDDYNRPSLAQTFEQKGGGATLTIVVNHLKSKGSDCDDVSDPNTRDGQANCAATRTAAATAIAQWLATDPTASGDSDFLIVGDLNAYHFEDPLTALENAGYTNLSTRSGGSGAYSSIWDGQAGALDHALASPTLLPQVADAIDWHINADEPAALDYNLTKSRDAGLFDAATPYRTSDHDPVIIGLNLTP
jgi:predicted extracellular nuclease